ncbi:hypothetical protein [Streptomyces zhihengii]|uniref:Serine/threonine protein kinase n=1 Tax=Streptomyces zhihengii TaxID=1818004 RepID=A0ABS2UIX1_9ACTN|nr:hypothetical protein [Streptomyces zhihengii]MBM9617526.1 hypothetical protein [Streptomyces zhihengii]
MDRRVRRTAAAALPSVLLGVWAVFLVLLGTSPGSPAVPGQAAASPATVRPAVLPASAPPRDGRPHAEVRAPSRSAADSAVQQTAAAEHTVRLPGAPPAVASAVHTARPAQPRGIAGAGPRQERAPPRDAYDPRHTRGPPATRFS